LEFHDPSSFRLYAEFVSQACFRIEALCPRIGIMADARLRCLGSAQHLKSKFGQGFQIEMKVSVVEPTDSDYIEHVRFLSPSKVDTVNEEEGEVVFEDIFSNLDEVHGALNALTGDDYLSSKVHPDSPVGYNIWKDATSATGCPLDELAGFATSELRMRNVENFMKSSYPGFVLRERQDSKVRYEIPSQGTRISCIFASLEDNKSALCLEDYGVSQTTLEQVFIHHAAEAERLKQKKFIMI
jgi:hypothetical protein